MARRVNFDFPGSLRLAARLYALSDSMEAHTTTRTGDAGTALAVWEGRYAREFVERREDEIALEEHAVYLLREEAEIWAQAWVDAMYQQNLYNRGEYVKQLAEQKSDDRGLFRKGTDWVGFTENNSLDDANSEVPIEPHPPRPTPPSYTATATEKQY